MARIKLQKSACVVSVGRGEPSSCRYYIRNYIHLLIIDHCVFFQSTQLSLSCQWFGESKATSKSFMAGLKALEKGSCWQTVLTLPGPSVFFGETG